MVVPGKEYPRRDSNPRLWLRRPVLYPLSYGGACGNYSSNHGSQQGRRTRRSLACLRLRLAPRSHSNLVQKGLDILVRGEYD